MTDSTDTTIPTADELAAKSSDVLGDLQEQGSELLDSATTTATSLFAQAQEAVESAFETTVEAIKEHPAAAAAIAAGAAAAVAGAAFGVSKLLEDDPAPSAKKK